MARRRMFSLDVVDSGQFIDLPITTRLLYYELGMRADDDGFVGNPKKVTKIAECTEKDLKILNEKEYVYIFDSGVLVIRHWNMNNQIRHDRYNQTCYIAEKNKLYKENNVYYLIKDKWLPDGIPMVATDKISIDKNSVEKISKEKNSLEKKREEKNNIEEKREDLIILSGNDIVVKDVIDYLNKKINSSYNWENEKIKGLINNWIEKGYKTLDFQIVIDKKFDEWKDTKMVVHFNPYTLFGDKFENYYNQPVKKKTLNDISMKELEKMIESRKNGEENENNPFSFY